MVCQMFYSYLQRYFFKHFCQVRIRVQTMNSKIKLKNKKWLVNSYNSNFFLISQSTIYLFIDFKLLFDAEITECKSIFSQNLSVSRKVGFATHLITDFIQRFSSLLDFFINIFVYDSKTVHCEIFAWPNFHYFLADFQATLNW